MTGQEKRVTRLQGAHSRHVTVLIHSCLLRPPLSSWNCEEGEKGPSHIVVVEIVLLPLPLLRLHFIIIDQIFPPEKNNWVNVSMKRKDDTVKSLNSFLTCSHAQTLWTHQCSKRSDPWRAAPPPRQRWTWRVSRQSGCWAHSSESSPRSQTQPEDREKSVVSYSMK